MLFTERLALLLDTGVSLHEALKGLHQQTAEPRLRAIIGAVSESILEGSALSAALAAHPEMFSLTYVNLVVRGRARRLPARGAEAADRDGREEPSACAACCCRRCRIPAFLIFFSSATIVFVLVSVFPRFADRCSSASATSCRVDAGADGVLGPAAQPLAVGARRAPALLAALGWTALRQPAARDWLDALKLRLPLLAQPLRRGLPDADAARHEPVAGQRRAAGGSAARLPGPGAQRRLLPLHRRASAAGHRGPRHRRRLSGSRLHAAAGAADGRPPARRPATWPR